MPKLKGKEVAFEHTEEENEAAEIEMQAALDSFVEKGGDLAAAKAIVHFTDGQVSGKDAQIPVDLTKCVELPSDEGGDGGFDDDPADELGCRHAPEHADGLGFDTE